MPINYYVRRNSLSFYGANIIAAVVLCGNACAYVAEDTSSDTLVSSCDALQIGQCSDPLSILQVSPATQSMESVDDLLSKKPVDQRAALIDEDKILRTDHQLISRRLGKRLQSAEMRPIDIEVTGGNEALRKNVAQHLRTITVQELEEFSVVRPRARQLSRDAADALGFFNAIFQIEKESSTKIRVRVTAGPQTFVDEQVIRIEGDASGDDVIQQRIQHFGDQRQKPLDQIAYDAFRRDLMNLLAERGYFDTRWYAREIRVDRARNSAQIRIALDSGTRYKMGQVQFTHTNKKPEGPDLPIQARYLDQLTPFREGQPYEGELISRLSRQLSNTRFFTSVRVIASTPEPSTTLVGANNQLLIPTDDVTADGVHLDEDFAVRLARQTKEVPVNVELSTEKPNSAELGLGYGTDSGVRLRGQYRRGLLNQYGHSVESSFEVSQETQKVDIRYQMPYKHPTNDTVTVFAGVENEQLDLEGVEVSTQPITVGVERTIRPINSGWQRTWALRYIADRLQNDALVGVDPKVLPAPFNVAGAADNQQALLLSFSLNKLTTAASFDPNFAMRQYYQVETGSRQLLSDADMFILRAGWSGLKSVGEAKRHQLVGRLDNTAIFTDRFSDVPFKLRLFAGGDRSIRGFDYKSLSPQVNGYSVGGKYMSTGSLEYNYEIIPKLRIASFVDAGNSFSQDFLEPVRYGVGVGIRYSSPVGPIRLDVATGLHEETYKSDSIRLHFFIGPAL